ERDQPREHRDRHDRRGRDPRDRELHNRIARVSTRPALTLGRPDRAPQARSGQVNRGPPTVTLPRPSPGSGPISRRSQSMATTVASRPANGSSLSTAAAVSAAKKLRPLGDRVVVRPLPSDDTTKS